MQPQLSKRKPWRIVCFMAVWSICFAPMLLASYAAAKSTGAIRRQWPASAAAALFAQLTHAVLLAVIAIPPYFLVLLGVRWVLHHYAAAHAH
jgi:hypothetical protein